jgi:hypothetical protein
LASLPVSSGVPFVDLRLEQVDSAPTEADQLAAAEARPERREHDRLCGRPPLAFALRCLGDQLVVGVRESGDLRLGQPAFAEWLAAGRPPPGQRPGEGTVIGTRRLLSGEVQEWPRYAVGAVPPTFEGDLERVPLLVGESCSVVNDIKPAAQIVKDLVQDAEALLAGAKQHG